MSPKILKNYARNHYKLLGNDVPQPKYPIQHSANTVEV